MIFEREGVQIRCTRQIKGASNLGPHVKKAYIVVQTGEGGG